MGTTANYSWPYPESSDFVADGATAMENLADAADATVASLSTGNLQYIVAGSGVGAGYPSTVTLSSPGIFAWPAIAPSVAYTASAGETLLFIVQAAFTLTAANVMEFQIYDSGTAIAYSMGSFRGVAGSNMLAAHTFVTPTVSGARSWSLYVSGNTGTIQVFGSEQQQRLSLYRIRP